MIGPVAQLFASIGLNTAGLEAGIAKSTGMLAATGPLAMAALAGGAVVAGVGVIATKMAGDFESGITSLATGAGEDVKNLSMVSAGILQMAKDTGTSTSQLVAGMYMIESGGYHGAAGLAILQAAAEGAKVGAADLGVTADATDTILKNYPDVLNGASGAVNTLIATVAHGKTHMEDLASSLAQILPTAASAGISLNDVMAGMATMTAEGVPAAEAATYLRQTIIALSAPASGAKDALKSIGLSASDVAHEMQHSLPGALKMIENALTSHGIKVGSVEYIQMTRDIMGGMRQMQGALDLGGTHLTMFTDNVKIIAGQVKSGGTAIEGWALTQKTFNVQLARAGEVAQTLGIQLGQNLLPVATNLFAFIADNAIPTLKRFGDFLGSNSQGSTAFKLVLLAVAGAITANLVVAFSAWAAAAGAAAIETIVATSPILAIGAAIALLVAGVMWANQNWPWFHDNVDKVKVVAGAAAAVLVGFFTPALIAAGVQSAVAGGKIAASFISGTIKAGVEAWTAVGKVATFIASLVQTGAEAVIAGAKIAASWIATVVRTGVESVLAGAKIVGSFVASMIAAGAQAVIAGAKITASFIASLVQSGFAAALASDNIMVAYGASLIQSGIQATIAGTKIAASWVANVVASGAAAVTNGAKIAASFVGNLVASGAAAVANGAKVVANFVASMATAGATAVASGAKIAASFVANLVASGTAAIANAAKVTVSFVASLIKTGLQAAVTGSIMLVSLIPAIIAVGVQAAVAAAAAIPGLVAGFVAWAISAGAAAVATIAATWPVLAIVAAIALLAAGIIYAYNNWGWFKIGVDTVRTELGLAIGVIGNLVGWLLGHLGPALGWTGDRIGELLAWLGHLKDRFGDLLGTVGNFVGGILGWFGSLPGKLLELGKQMMNNLAAGIRNAAGNVTSALKNIPGIGGVVSNIIPHFASGGTMQMSGVALVGEDGPELVRLPAGAEVISNNQLAFMSSGGGRGNASSAQPLVINVNIDGKRAAQAIVPHIHGIVRNATGNRKI